MKVMILALVALTSSQAFAADCGSVETEALRRARGYWEAGEETRTTVAKAELALAKALYACDELTKEEFCEQATLAAEVVVLGTQAEASVGQKSAKDIAKAKRARQAVRKTCN